MKRGGGGKGTTASSSASPTTAASNAPLSSKKLFLGETDIGFIQKLAAIALQIAGTIFAVYNAYRIRTYALVEYGNVIHEFDPWFNYRATEYLSDHGWHAFFHWFDHMSWYPLGRPVGTTIYPGLQITSVAIHRALQGTPYEMSLNDICCYVPCWFGAIATVILMLITLEATKSRTAAVISGIVMSMIPAHIMRSVGGGYDNESIAITAMLLTFYLWIRSLRSAWSWPIGIFTGLAYGYMVAAWGGYVFVLNMVAFHAGVCMIVDMLKNRYDPTLHHAYSLFFIIGTAIAICVPPVGLAPFKSLEQMLALLVFIFMQTIHVSEIHRKKLSVEIMSKEGIRLRTKYIAATIGILVAAVIVVVPSGFFGPLSSRVRALFVSHTRTGNPLVDSVAEHQPATANAYWTYLHMTYYFWLVSIIAFPLLKNGRGRACGFLALFGAVSYYFSLKMARLILLSGPCASAGCGLALAFLLEWAVGQFSWSQVDAEEVKNAAAGKTKDGKPLRKGAYEESFEGSIAKVKLSYVANRNFRIGAAVALLAFLMGSRMTWDFYNHSENMARSFSNPQVMFKTRLSDGSEVIIDDYREAYHWLRDKTPEDSRVMAWWDYGYQITGIGNRTSIADGNTWNHEHIATLGKCLTSPVKEAHSLVRHLADYVLVWAGGGGDDLAKSPHMARIGNSVYHDICPKEDPLCTHFGFEGNNHDKPTPTMKASLLYNIHAHGTRPGVYLDPKLFQEAFTSKYRLVRIFKVMNVSQESKDWVANPANRKCDAPGSWYCPGQYPPAEPIQAMLAKRQDFSQLEDFNANKKNDEYHKQYMKRMSQVHG